ncbi:Crp/Fnr family transcriptional regulator [Mucilaginibacter sabulilitoris]|uniref:Crp/Fnr family transcriptional regulator n=1 Tax=Mucilaginibacter sabulilitoris TaxID=1173583 RepID=A0ABZ0TLE1_9SPHI|nr:Crp/Fnr family transcriptional regulator [Mucilaginibacter sabulilitoris]WPU93232.1 Crp/Fnr family transcriptional regulator [Mucilaginibacter sabulilitoris]
MCRNCINDWIPAIATNRENFTLKKGQQLFKEGDAVTGIYFMYKGVVKVHKQWDQEKDLILRFAKQGDIVGHLGLGDTLTYPVSATAIEPGIVCYVKMDFFESSLNVNSQLTYKLMKFLANELQESEKRMRNLAHMPVKERIAQALLSLRSQFGLNEAGFVDIELTRQDISSYASVVYETFFKVTQEFIQNNLIELDGKSFKLLNEAALKEITLSRKK